MITKDNILDRIVDSIKKPRSIGLDIGATSVKLLEVEESHGKHILTSYHTEPIEEGVIDGSEVRNPERLAEIVKSAYENSGAKSNRVVLTISGGPLVTKRISLPKMSEYTVEKVIQQEVKEQLGSDPSETYLDFYILGEDVTRPGNMIVVVAIAQKEYIDIFKEIVSEAGLQLDCVDPACFVVERAWRAVEAATAKARKGSPTESYSNFALINVGAEFTNVALISNGKIVSTCDVNIGGKTLTAYIQQSNSISMERAEILKIFTSGQADSDSLDHFYTDLSSAVIRIVDNYTSTDQEFHLDEIVLSGGGILIKGAEERIEKDLETPTRFLESLKSLHIPENFSSSTTNAEGKKEESSNDLEGGEAKMALALGAALRDQRITDKGVKINLIPYRTREKERKIISSLFYTVTCLLASLFIVIPFHITKKIDLSIAEGKLATLQAQISTEQKRVDKITKMEESKKEIETKLKVIKYLQDSRTDTLNMLDNLAWGVPRGVVLKSAQANENKVTLKGLATNDKSISELMRTQSASDLFIAAKLVTVTEVKVNNVSYKNFTIILTRPPLPKASGDNND